MPIRGQQGLGKARIARRIHDLSDRRAAPFLVVNTFRDEALDDTLAAAPAAVSDGTLFVNGVGRLDVASQDRLMVALWSASFRLAASSGTRIVGKAEAGGFRADLLYALVSNEIVVPPLPQRIDDAIWLAGQLFQALNSRRPTPLRGISDLAEAAIRDHDWPGNGRELRSRLVRAMEAADGDWVFPADIFPELNEDNREVQTLSEAREAAERRQIIKILGQIGGQIAEAARLLKVSRTTLWEKMQKLGL